MPKESGKSRLSSTDVLAAAGVVALGASFVLSPHGIEDGPVICPFRRLTGLPCPGCGLTRSWVYAAHGWWKESFLAHPFGLVAAAAVITMIVLTVRARVFRKAAPRGLDSLVRNPLVIGFVALWLGWAAVRLVLAI